MASSLQGKVAIVTGGSRGIGLATASALLAEGIHVTISGLNARRLLAAEAELGQARAKGAELHAEESDVRDHLAVEALVDATVHRWGGLDILVNNAGIGRFADVASQSPDDWRRVIDTNLTGVFYCCRAAIPHLRRRGGGWIVNISSLAANSAFAGAAGYCASKAGLNAFSDALMQEVRYDDIRVSCIMPGYVNTEFAGQADDTGADWKLQPEDVARVVVDLISHDRRSLPSRIELRPSKPRR
jgi:3-oxoacyl-[acyl-carrier protein] reductase